MNPSLFINESLFSSVNHHHQTKNHHKKICNSATFRPFSVKKTCSNVKRHIPRLDSAVKPKFRGSVRNSPRKTVGSKDQRFDHTTHSSGLDKYRIVILSDSKKNANTEKSPFKMKTWKLETL